jgi:hypothetical protein
VQLVAQNKQSKRSTTGSDAQSERGATRVKMQGF